MSQLEEFKRRAELIKKEMILTNIDTGGRANAFLQTQVLIEILDTLDTFLNEFKDEINK